jgi:periplasmic mercuric ion binding protein
MKTIKFIATAMIAVTTSAFIFAGAYDQSKMASTKTETIKVSGKCDMCKSRIEKAAKMDGVSKAEWNKDTKILTLAYDPSKVTSDAVQKSIAAVGYDTEKFKATDAAYKSLPSCCQYDRNGTASKGTSESCK